MLSQVPLKCMHQVPLKEGKLSTRLHDNISQKNEALIFTTAKTSSPIVVLVSLECFVNKIQHNSGVHSVTCC
jgi:hypothetical protein